MDYTVLEKSALFSGIPTKELCNDLNTVPHHIQRYDKGETIFHLMENASRIGIVLEGNVQAQKPFPNGSQINVSVRKAGELIGAAAAFSRSQKYPCDVVALESATILFFQREDILLLLQKDLRIMKNFISELAITEGFADHEKFHFRACYRKLYAPAASRVAVLQWNCAKGRILSSDPGTAVRQKRDQDSRFGLKLGNDHERFQVVPSSGAQKA